MRTIPNNTGYALAGTTYTAQGQAAKLGSGETWKTYTDHLLEVFRNLGEAGQFADVTLVSDDQSMNNQQNNEFWQKI